MGPQALGPGIIAIEVEHLKSHGGFIAVSDVLGKGGAAGWNGMRNPWCSCSAMT